MKFSLGETGDTLVEVVFSIAIISVTLASAYNVANNSYRIGVQSRERIEAANIAQEQAELLRAWRDQNVTNNLPDVVPNPGGHFMVRRIPGGFTTISCNAAPDGCEVGTDRSVAAGNRYRLSIGTAAVGTNFAATAGPDGLRYTISVNWTRVGGSGDENAEITTTLVDRRADRTLIDCDEVEKCS